MASSRFTISLCCLVLGLNSLVVGWNNDDIVTAEGGILKRQLVAKPDGEIRSFFVNPKNSDIFYLEFNEKSKTDKIKVIKSGSTNSYIIDGYEGIPQSFTPDFDNNVIYLGAYNGVYQIPMDTFKAEALVDEEIEDVADVHFVNNNLYVVQYEGSPFKYVWVDGKPTREDISPAITLSDPHISVDTEETIYYVNDEEKLWKRTKDGSLSAVIIEGEVRGGYATALDAKDRLLIVNFRNMYTLNKGEDEVALLLATPEDVTAIATDNDSSIYTLENNKIYKYSKP